MLKASIDKDETNVLKSESHKVFPFDNCKSELLLNLLNEDNSYYIE